MTEAMIQGPIFEGRQRLYVGDCLSILPSLPADSVDIVITSPPYNLGQEYGVGSDRLPYSDYLCWMGRVFLEIARVLRPDGSFFLNVGFTSRHPWIAMDVAQEARSFFYLQNHFCWVKSISIQDGMTYGHFKPITSPRYVNQCWEHVFHLTKTGNVPVNRLAIGVPYVDKSNLTRANRGKNGDIRCRGNTWYVPYETVQSRHEKGDHPAVFPIQLVHRCLFLHGLTLDSVVLDPFMGTGTTLAACEPLGVTGIGIDLNPDCINYARKRILESRGND